VVREDVACDPNVVENGFETGLWKGFFVLVWDTNFKSSFWRRGSSSCDENNRKKGGLLLHSFVWVGKQLAHLCLENRLDMRLELGKVLRNA